MKTHQLSTHSDPITKDCSTNTALSYWTDNVTDPRDPVGRIKLSDLMNYDQRCTHKHKVVWEFHLSWSHKDYGWTSLASVRTIREKLLERSPSGSALSARHISVANRDLCAWGYLTEIEKGTGRWASRFLVNWDLLDHASKGDFPISVSHGGNATVAYPTGDTQSAGKVHANDDLRFPRGAQRPGYLDPAKDGDIGSGNVSAAPDAGALAGTAPASGFERVWQAYGKYGNKQQARAAFSEIDLETYPAAMIEAKAASWAKSAKPGQRRMSLEKWLAAEKYDEADRHTSRTDLPSMPRGAVRRDATIESIEDNHLILRWHDAEQDEPTTHRKPVLTTSYRSEIAADLGVQELQELAGRRILLDLWENAEGEDCERWHLHPANDNAHAEEAANG